MSVEKFEVNKWYRSGDVAFRCAGAGAFGRADEAGWIEIPDPLTSRLTANDEAELRRRATEIRAEYRRGYDEGSSIASEHRSKSTADRRFQAACAAMQGLIASGIYSFESEAAQDAVKAADALLDALKKEEK